MSINRVLFIAGQGRSGSTLAERVLAELPGVCALGEATHIWQDRLYEEERCGCGTRFAACGFWTAVGDRAFGGWHNVDRSRMVAVLSAVGRTRAIPWLVRPSRERRALIAEFVENQTRVYAAASAVAGAQVVIDSSKYPALAYCLRWASDIDVRIVHLVRDPRGVAYSWTKHMPRPETDGATMVPCYRPSRSALKWGVHNAAMEVLARIGPREGTPLGAPVRRVRYEDFVADARGVTYSLARFAGLEPRASELSHVGDDYVDLGAIHSASGNPMRFAVGRIPLRRDDGWRTGLPAGQRHLVSAICAPALAAYGYPLIS